MKTKTFQIVLFLALLFSFIFISNLSAEEDSLKTDKENDLTVLESDSSLIYILQISGTIGVVTEERIAMAIEQAEDENAELLIIEMNTPGGFANATRDIGIELMSSEVPTCVYVSPSGSHSGSAGVYIAYAANFAAMAEATNIGSAHPVGGGGQQIDSVMNEKVTNDAVAQIKSYADKRGRNAEWAEEAVRQSVNITDNEALELNVINYRAKDIDDLLKKLDGDTTEVKSSIKVVSTKNRKIYYINPTFKDKILDIITSPEIAFVLLSLGGLGIMLEIYNPGAILPGVVGAICILIAAYAFQFLPINYTGILLMIVAAVLFIAEVKVVSHGILTVGGLVALFFGGLMLIDTVDPNLRISTTFLIFTVAAIGIVVGFLSYFVIKAHRNRPFIGQSSMIGKEAEVRTEGMVYVDGALWKAECDEELQKGDKVEIIEELGLKLKVKKK